MTRDELGSQHMTAGWSSLVWFVSHLVKQLLEREASYLSRKCLLNWRKKKERLPLPRRMLSVLSSSHALLCLPETPRDSLSWLSKVWEMFEEFSNPLSDLWKHTPPLAQYKIQYSVIKTWASEITRGGCWLSWVTVWDKHVFGWTCRRGQKMVCP